MSYRKFLTFLQLVLVFPLFSQSKEIKRIGLDNPTPVNLERVLYLIQNKYITLDSVQLVCVIDMQQRSLFDTLVHFIQHHKDQNIIIEEVHSLPLDSVFCTNQATADFERIFQKTDAMIFLGGEDIPPKVYGESTFLTTEYFQKDRNWELSYLFHLVGRNGSSAYSPLIIKRSDYVVLGICLGMQEMNVAMGGSLYQDIPYQVYHLSDYEQMQNQDPENQHRNYQNRIDNNGSFFPAMLHHIKPFSGSYLDNCMLKTFPLVISAHHQGIKELAVDYKIVATSMDGKIIEAIENKKFKNVYGVQFHPEASILYNPDSHFHISAERDMTLDNNSIQFHIRFWNQFSQRVNLQKELKN